METNKEIIKAIFSDENGVWSSKRIIGFIGAMCLFVNMFVNNTEYGVDAVLIIALGSLGITGLEAVMQKFGSRKTKKLSSTKTE